MKKEVCLLVDKYDKKRHRIHEEELGEVKEGLRLRLLHHLDTKKNLEDATNAFKAYYRITKYDKKAPTGRPIYPSPITWSTISWFLNSQQSKLGGKPSD